MMALVMIAKMHSAPPRRTKLENEGGKPDMASRRRRA